MLLIFSVFTSTVAGQMNTPNRYVNIHNLVFPSWICTNYYPDQKGYVYVKVIASFKWFLKLERLGGIDKKLFYCKKHSTCNWLNNLRRSYFSTGAVEQTIFNHLRHESVNDLNCSLAAVFGGLQQLVFRSLFVRISSTHHECPTTCKQSFASFFNRQALEFLPKAASDCSSFSDKSKIWPVV